MPSSVSHRKKTHFLSVHFTLPCYFNIPTLSCAEVLSGREIRQECGGHVLGGWLETAVCLRCVVFSSPPVGLLGLELRRWHQRSHTMRGFSLVRLYLCSLCVFSFDRYFAIGYLQCGNMNVLNIHTSTVSADLFQPVSTVKTIYRRMSLINLNSP